jgi:hypothetical protein
MGSDTESWVLRCDGSLVHNNQTLHRLREPLQEGDILGVSFDHLDLKFWVNNSPIEYSVTGIKGGDLFPVLYVDEGAILDSAFTSFQFQPPPGFDRILIEKSLL